MRNEVGDGEGRGRERPGLRRGRNGNVVLGQISQLIPIYLPILYTSNLLLKLQYSSAHSSIAI